eukprot:gene44681-55600_t
MTDGDLKPLDSVMPGLRLQFQENGGTLLDSVSNEHDKLVEKRSKLKALKAQLGRQDETARVNFGGTCLEIDRKMLNTYPNSL